MAPSRREAFLLPRKPATPTGCTQWFVRTFPQANFHYVNGGIGGTDSFYGVSRAVNDVLMYQPDFVVVDFSVNDTKLAFRQETYEGVVRKLLSWPSHPAVVLLNNIYYDTGLTAEDDHVAVGDHYGVPHVSIRDSIYRELKAGTYARPQLSPDGLHPNDFGHGLVAGEIIKLLENVNAHREKPEAEAVFPSPLTANAYENARRLTIREISPSWTVSVPTLPRKPAISTTGKTAGLDTSPVISSPLRWMLPALRCSIARPFVALRCGHSWFWTATPPTLFCWTVTLTRTGATACICSLSCTTGNIEHTPWS
ncbi:MAG: SGNH/GDSL hydrolase family protein [Faecalibacterium sp.]